jgi:hypothetical protein
MRFQKEFGINIVREDNKTTSHHKVLLFACSLNVPNSNANKLFNSNSNNSNNSLAL